ncbi:26967_t:CDS:2, partial [Racocetra persica]
ITHQESYPLLKIKDKSSFLDLPKNVYLAVETLTPEISSKYQNQEALEYQTQEALEYQIKEISK